MPRMSKGLRRVELALWAIGILLVGVALVATSARWRYQAQQERAFSEPPQPQPGPVIPVEWVSNPTPLPAIEKKADPIQPDVKKPAAVAKKADAKKPGPPRETREPALDPAALGRIEIPRLGVRAIIRKGADEDTLDRAVGLVPGTASPGETGNVVLAAHRDTFFRPLRHIKVADRIRLVVPPNEYVYEVDSTRVVAPEETSVLRSRGTEELTLVTCYPFGFIGPAPDRFIVSAKRVQ